jgi:hypothetical protein
MLVTAIESNPDISLVSAPYRLSDTGELTGLVYESPHRMTFRELLCEEGRRTQKAAIVLLRRNIIGDIRFVAPNLDFIFYRKIARKTDFLYLPQPIGTYYRTESDHISLHVLRRVPNIEKSILRAKELSVFIREFGPDIVKYCPRKYSTYAYGAGVGTLLIGQQWDAIKFFAQAVKFQPFRMRYLSMLCFSLLPGAPLILRLLFLNIANIMVPKRT